jgi:hypothetical protein
VSKEIPQTVLARNSLQAVLNAVNPKFSMTRPPYSSAALLADKTLSIQEIIIPAQK